MYHVCLPCTGDASEAIGFSATQAVDDIEDFDDEGEGESGKRGGWTFRLPAKFTAEDVLACPWLATVSFLMRVLWAV